MTDEFFMQKAIDLAKKGSGYVHPNPLVGCIIVKNNEIIAEGYHQYFGGPHAEVNAIQSLEKKEFKEWNNVTLYVTLEPCSHFGKTPPCANLIIQKGIKNVVIAVQDPNPIVSGNGIKLLKNNGISVKTGILQKQAQELNKRFFTYHLHKRPYIILKWAETKDKFISKLNFQSKEDNTISSLQALKIVHQWRSEEHSILVGYNTVIKDNPQLNVRWVQGKNPIKIILDKNLNLKLNQFNLYSIKDKIIVINALKDKIEDNIIYKKINWEDLVYETIQVLYQLNIVSVFIEGGTKTLQKFLDAGKYDEIRIIKSKYKLFKDGVKAPQIPTSVQFSEEKTELADDTIDILKKINSTSY